eukprot:39607-Chlamydomonas_euryale.AAC.5
MKCGKLGSFMLHICLGAHVSKYDTHSWEPTWQHCRVTESGPNWGMLPRSATSHLTRRTCLWKRLDAMLRSTQAYPLWVCSL